MSHMEPYTLAQYHDTVKFHGSFGLSMSRLEATMQDYARLKHEELRLAALAEIEPPQGHKTCEFCKGRGTVPTKTPWSPQDVLGGDDGRR